MLTLIVAASALTGIPGCSDERPPAIQQEQMKPRRSVTDVLNDHAGRLMKIDGVVGVYEGRLENGDTCIAVMVAADRQGLEQDISPEVEGYPVRIEISGVIRPMR